MTVASTSSNLNQGGSALELSDFSSSSNRISKTGYTFDNAGNLTVEPGSKTYSYDGENKVVTAVVSSLTSKYWYDADGHRVKKIIGGVATRFVYNLAGQLIAEYDEGTSSLTKEYVYKGGALVATVEPTNVVKYATADHLGTPRVWTNSSGAVVTSGRHDYAPFGEELSAGYGVRTTGAAWPSSLQADGQRKQFGSKERDNETGLDYFGARYFASAQGRFTSPDPMMASGRASNPQSWNRYSYVLNRPLSLIDPSGMVDEDPNDPNKKKQVPPKPKVTVIVIGGGSNSSEASQSLQSVKPGGRVDGLGEDSLADYESQNIAQQIANDYPDADVTLSGPNGINQISTDIVNSKPDNVIIYGFSMGANSAVGLTNVLTNNGVKVDQLTTVDPPTATARLVLSSPTIKNPSMVGDAVNYTYLGKTVGGSQNVPITPEMRRLPTTTLTHGNADDISSRRVVQRIEGRLSQIFNRPQRQ